jgi:hypothetical protein
MLTSTTWSGATPTSYWQNRPPSVNVLERGIALDPHPAMVDSLFAARVANPPSVDRVTANAVPSARHSQRGAPPGALLGTPRARELRPVVPNTP